jgi:DNA-binding GntR family transcriptional regulator
VAYLTVRPAAQVLHDRGLIKTVRGRRTFAVDPLPQVAVDASSKDGETD